MLAPAHPEVLAPDYPPPTLVGRNGELERIRAWRLDGRRPPVAAIVGPSGSGTSAVARVAAQRALEELRREHPGQDPLLATVRVRWCRGSQHLAGALVQHLDDGFHAEGFPTNEILAGFLRRLRRDRRPAVVVLDDIGRSAPDLGPALRAFVHPARFLPEGIDDAPPLWLLLAGVPEALAAWAQVERAGIGRDRRIDLAPYPRPSLELIVRDRLARALARPPPEALVGRILDRCWADGGSAVRALELMRRTLLGPSSIARPHLAVAAGAPVLAVEPHFVEAIDRALSNASAELGEVRAWEARLARRDGRRPLPATTLWRRLIRLESMGLVRRSVRPGGAGGTRSTLELLTPVSDWPIPRASSGTLPTAVPF